MLYIYYALCDGGVTAGISWPPLPVVAFGSSHQKGVDDTPERGRAYVTVLLPCVRPGVRPLTVGGCVCVCALLLLNDMHMPRPHYVTLG